jgi:methylmalonyl-CoA mutase cobalamin-binding subunit
MAASRRGSTSRQFNGVKVFSATMAQDREHLGDKITEWLSAHAGVEIVDTTVTQSSDEAFHCLAITLFYNLPG